MSDEEFWLPTGFDLNEDYEQTIDELTGEAWNLVEAHGGVVDEARWKDTRQAAADAFLSTFVKEQAAVSESKRMGLVMDRLRFGFYCVAT